MGAPVGRVWVVRVGGDDGELRPYHYIYVYIIESRPIMKMGGGYLGWTGSVSESPHSARITCLGIGGLGLDD
jgi:hypothetical protein